MPESTRSPEEDDDDDQIRAMTSAKRLFRKQSRLEARMISCTSTEDYCPWSPDQRIDFVLVYKPVKRSSKYAEEVEANPRPNDVDDVEASAAPKGNTPSKLRVEYIQTLRENGLVIEIENFISKGAEFRAIKIYGKEFAMDTWAGKFLLMKPVCPPHVQLIKDWKVEREWHHDVTEVGDLYNHEEEASTTSSEGHYNTWINLKRFLRRNENVEAKSLSPECAPAGPAKPARLYPTLDLIREGEEDGTPEANWGRVRAVFKREDEKPVDRLIALYNESLYRLPRTPEYDRGKEKFDAEGYVPSTFKKVVGSVAKTFRRSSSRSEDEPSPKSKRSKSIYQRSNETYKETEAFKQLRFLNERYGSFWKVRFHDWIFRLLHGDDERLTLMKDNFISRAIRAPFNPLKKHKFLAYGEHEFYNSSERSRMVFRILEDPELKLHGKKATLKLRDMYRQDCFEAAYPLHAGGYKIGGVKTTWSDLALGEIDNPRKLLRYFWSSSHMKYRFQPINIIRNYFGAVTAMYFAYLGYYNMALFAPAIVGTAVFIYGIVQMYSNEMVAEICDSGETYLMCTECYITGHCNATYISDYCFTTKITSAANNGAVIVFSVFTMLWLALFVTFWKRQQNTIAHTWGTTHSKEATGELRVKYTLTKTSVFRFNRATGRRERHVTFFNRLPQYAIAFTVVAMFLALALMLTLTITIYNYTLYASLRKTTRFSKKYAKELATLITGGMSATLIIILSVIYRRVAHKLTDMENHRTQRDHDNHLTFKIYLFEFVNYYGTLFYIAFLKGNITSPKKRDYLLPKAEYLQIEGCAPGGCMSEVATQMIIIMTFKQVIPILRDVVRTLNLNRLQEQLKIGLMAPLQCIECVARYRRQSKRNLREFKETRPQFVQDFELREATEMYQEYVYNVIQLGFLTMFVTALPIAPLISLVINMWQLRNDAKRYVKRVKRPVGFRAEGIGTWMNILEFLCRIAILVNAVLIAFTFDYLPNLLYQIDVKKSYTLEGYVNFMLAHHNFTDSNNVNKTCRFWSYIQPANTHDADFWLNLMVIRMVFVFLFQNIVWALVRAIELMVSSTPKSVKERMVLEEKIAQEWLSDTEDESEEEEARNRDSDILDGVREDEVDIEETQPFRSFDDV